MLKLLEVSILGEHRLEKGWRDIKVAHGKHGEHGKRAVHNLKSFPKTWS